MMVKNVLFGGQLARLRPTDNSGGRSRQTLDTTWLRQSLATFDYLIPDRKLDAYATRLWPMSARKKPQIRLIQVTDCGCYIICDSV